MYFLFARVGAGNNRPVRAPYFYEARQIDLLEGVVRYQTSQWMWFSAHLHGLGNVIEVFGQSFFGCLFSSAYSESIVTKSLSSYLYVYIYIELYMLYAFSCLHGFGFVFFGQKVPLYDYMLFTAQPCSRPVPVPCLSNVPIIITTHIIPYSNDSTDHPAEHPHVGHFGTRYCNLSEYSWIILRCSEWHFCFRKTWSSWWPFLSLQFDSKHGQERRTCCSCHWKKLLVGNENKVTHYSKQCVLLKSVQTACHTNFGTQTL